MDIDKHLGLAVRQRRKCRGWSLVRLADALDVSFQQLQKYENGENRISASRLYRLADVLDCGVEDFFAGLPGAACVGGDPEGFGAVGRAFLGADGGVELARAFLALPPAQRRGLAAAARAMAANAPGGAASPPPRLSWGPAD